MASDPQLERRVTRLENDRDAMYEILTDVQTVQRDHTRRLDGIDRRLDGIDGRLDRMDQRFDSIDTVLVEVLRRLPDAS